MPAHRLALGHLDESFRLVADLTDARGVGGVAVVALDDGPAVDRDDVPFGRVLFPGMPCTIMSLGLVQITAGKPL